MGFRPRPALLASSLVLAFGLVSHSLVIAAPGAEPPGVLAGVVRDAFGQALADVEVLVLPDRSAAALASAVTGPDGRFRLPGLPAGLYRIAALKPGYLASVTRANTFVRSTVDVVLRPLPRAGEPGAENVLARPSWVLRAPPRSVLRETELREIASAGSPSNRDERGEATSLATPVRSLDIVDGQFRHLVALGSNAADGGSGAGPIVGGETSMQLSGALGQRGSLRLAGRRESLATSRKEFDGTAEGSRNAESLAFDLSYDTSRDTSLDVSAYFAQGDVRIGSVPEQRLDENREARRAWGYDATWTMQLDQASRFAVSLGYRDASLEVPGNYLPGLDAGLAGASRSLTNRSIGAAGSYEVLAGDNHLVRVGARAQALDLALPFVRDGGETAFVDLPGGAGWSIRIDAEDAWSVSAPWTVVYGLGVQQVLAGPDATLLVPRTGAIWSPGRLSVEFTVSYYTVAGWGGESSAEAADPYVADRLTPSRPWGWESEVSVPFGNGVAFRAGHSFEPLRDGSRAFGAQEPVTGASPLIVGSRASDRRSSLALTRETGRVSTSFAWSWGRAEGLIGQAAGFQLPVQILADREIGYRQGRVDVRVPSSGTDVTFAYGRFRESPPAGFEVAFVNSYVELALGQQVGRLARLGATCRVLLAARLVPTSDQGDDGTLQRERSRAIAALNQQVSAGLLVAF